ncbi:MAG TPA: TetR/AcrR family transcriptional regulator [Gemmatimonadaceae bacterium]|nr:TetR/AcrR family transcriptional regulator [Gemmatimonadaceae bacterium]
MPRTITRPGPRARILEAAADRFRTLGPRAFTMTDVAEHVGLTTPALYRHFKGREDLLAELVQEGFTVFTQYLARGLRGNTPRERLDLTSAAYFDFAVDHPGYYETIFLTADIPGLRRFPDLELGRSASFQLLVDRVRECMDAGFFTRGNAADIALTMWAQAHGFMTLNHFGRFTGSRAQIRARFLASVQRLFDGIAA